MAVCSCYAIQMEKPQRSPASTGPIETSPQQMLLPLCPWEDEGERSLHTFSSLMIPYTGEGPGFHTPFPPPFCPLPPPQVPA